VLPMTPMPSVRSPVFIVLRLISSRNVTSGRDYGADYGEAVGGMPKKPKLLESGPATASTATSRARGKGVG
jgi:hypothetical protein